jgi:hypothetical protein
MMASMRLPCILAQGKRMKPYGAQFLFRRERAFLLFCRKRVENIRKWLQKMPDHP